MVAASKAAPRAELPAEAAPALCRKDGRGDLQYRVRRGRLAGAPPVLLAGTGRDQVHLLLVCHRPNAALSGAFQLLDRASCPAIRAFSLMNQGKEVKFFCVGPQGL